MKKVGILDCGVGNIGSIVNSLARSGFDCNSISKSEELYNCSRLIMPGVGSFASYLARVRLSLSDQDLKQFVANKENRLIGICVGMQVLFSRGTEGKVCSGLNLVEGSVVKMSSELDAIRIPHVGWNHVTFREKALKTFDGEYYFTHSFVAEMAERDALAHFNYGQRYGAATRRENIFGLQFHPEKSGRLGEKLLSKLCE